MPTTRRMILQAGLAAAIPISLGFAKDDVARPAGPHIATNTYPWSMFARRTGQTLSLHTDSLLGEIAGAGLRGYEPIINTPDDMDGLAERLNAHGLEMRSIYVNSVLHDEQQTDASIELVLSIARRAQTLGTRIIVTNPSPIRWGGPEDKTDGQLRFQARALDRLGASLKGLGLTLAYHNHDAELRQGAREFHPLLTATDPSHVKLCLDFHWVYRGCGNSEVAVFDALSNYHDRLVELHLRQSARGVFNEAFTMAGDLDYASLLRQIKRDGHEPHLVLEQSVEPGTPETMSAAASHQAGVQNLLAGLLTT